MAHYASLPEFHFYHDGRRATCDVMVAGIRKALPAVQSLDVTYADVEVLALVQSTRSPVRHSSERSSWEETDPLYDSRARYLGSGARWVRSG